jgi:phosphoenolpyruvate synthase/pyruvate phosphate dikinase
MKRFAVRSSAVGEDSTDLSSAGQNETFLGCVGKEGIEAAVRKCWASLFAFQSVEYRRCFLLFLLRTAEVPALPQGPRKG